MRFISTFGFGVLSAFAEFRDSAAINSRSICYLVFRNSERRGDRNGFSGRGVLDRHEPSMDTVAGTQRDETAVETRGGDWSRR